MRLEKRFVGALANGLERDEPGRNVAPEQSRRFIEGRHVNDPVGRVEGSHPEVYPQEGGAKCR
jgi:hypothetical protein